MKDGLDGLFCYPEKMAARLLDVTDRSSSVATAREMKEKDPTWSFRPESMAIRRETNRRKS